MATAQSYQVILGAEGPAQLNYNQDSGRIIGFNLKKSGNKSTQTATITLNNEDGSVWNSELPPRSPVTISIEGVEAFNGFVDNLTLPEGSPGQLIVECIGRTAKLADSPVRPLIYGEGLSGGASTSESDFDALPVIVSGGMIDVPVGFRTAPIWQVGRIAYNNGLETNSFGPTPMVLGTAVVATTPSVFGSNFNSSRNQTANTQGLSYGQLPTPANFTFEGFIRPSSAATAQDIAGVRDGTSPSWRLRTSGSALLFDFWDSTATLHTLTGPTLSDGTIYHIEANWTGNSLHLFVNGALAAIEFPVTSIFPYQLPLRFGITSSFTGFFGDMDEFRYSAGIARHSDSFQVPTDPYEVDEFTVVLEHFDTVADAQAAGIHSGVILARTVDFNDNVILVDPKYNGTTAYLSYEVYRDKFHGTDAGIIINELIGRHGTGGVQSAIPSTGIDISFEPKLGSDLYVEIGRIRDILGPNYDFFLDENDTLQMVQRSTTSVRTIRGEECHGASFSTDYAAYANSVTARAGSGIENDIGPFIGYLENYLEDETVTSPAETRRVDALAQGFKALGNRLGSFSFRGKRQTEEDAIDYEVQYNGKRNAIPHVSPTIVQSLSPDSINMAIDQAGNGNYHVKNGGAVGTAYFSNSWTPESVTRQVTANSFATAMGANTYQTITVADLARMTIKGIAFSSNSTAGTVRFDIYSGTAGTAGTLLGTSEDVTLAGTDNREMISNWWQVYFATPVDVSAQTNISIVAVGSAGQAWGKNTAGGYAGGQASSGAGEDFAFQIFTVTTVLSEAFAGVYHNRESADATTLSDPLRTPQYYISSNYVIGSPGLATWSEVTLNVPRIMSSVAPAGVDIGFKISFNDSSQTFDPLINLVRESVAFENGETALTDPCGIVVGDLFDSVGVKAMPYFNPETGTQTEDIAVPDAGRLEIGANYWLVMRDGNVANTKSYFTALYSDGASVIFENNWDLADYNDLHYPNSLSVSRGFSGSFAPTGQLRRVDISGDPPLAESLYAQDSIGISSDSEAATAQIVSARVVASNTPAGGSILTLVSRNRRNYYFPGKSQTPGLPAVKTGEVLIWQFDDADPAPQAVPGGYPGVVDKSGHGFDGYWATVARTDSDGKFGQAFCNKGNSAASGVLTAVARPNDSRLGLWLQEDITIGFWFKKTTVDASQCTIQLGNDATHFSFKLGFTAAGRLTYTHSNSLGAGSETLTSTNPVLVAATYKHIMVAMRRNIAIGALGVGIYVDGAFVEDLTASTTPDRCYTNEFVVTLKPNTVGTPDIKIDEVRIWPYAADTAGVNHSLDLVKSLSIANPYNSGLALLTFPSEADATDDYTDSTTADTAKLNIQFLEAFFPAPYQADYVVLNLPFNLSSSLAQWKPFTKDISSFGHAVSSDSPPTETTGGTGGTLQADFNGTANYLKVAHNLYLHLGQRFTFSFRMKQDVTGVAQTIFYKHGEFSLTAKATSSTTTDFLLVLSHIGGVTFIPFQNVAVGTGTHDIIISMGEPNGGPLAVSMYVDNVTAGELAAGMSIVVPAYLIADRPRAASTYPMMIGCRSDKLDGTSRSQFFDGKLDAILWINVPASPVVFYHNNSTLLPIEYTLRSPKQESLTVLGYSGAKVNLYPDGKYVVSRDNENTWGQSLDGATTDTSGLLSFAMTFDKDDLQCNKRDIAEIARVGSVVEKVFDFPTQDAATLCTVAGGYLDLLSDGLEKGRINIDGTTDLDVGQVVTINYPQKAQFFKEYGIAAIETTVSDGIYRTALQLGEEERGIASLFGTSEVGIK